MTQNKLLTRQNQLTLAFVMFGTHVKVAISEEMNANLAVLVLRVQRQVSINFTALLSKSDPKQVVDKAKAIDTCFCHVWNTCQSCHLRRNECRFGCAGSEGPETSVN